MYLDAANGTAAEPAVEYTNDYCGREIFEPWADWPPSQVSHHGRVCCEIVREWITSVDFSSLNGGDVLTGPRWLRQRFEWGPTRYPVYWCEISKKKELDCGMHAALAHEVFVSRGVKSFRTQLVQEFSHCAASQWESKWKSGSAVTAWIDKDLIYHEGCAVVSPQGELKLWDPSAGWWLDPKNTGGYGSLRAVRIFASSQEKPHSWGGRVIPPNEWFIFR